MFEPCCERISDQLAFWAFAILYEKNFIACNTSKILRRWAYTLKALLRGGVESKAPAS